MLEMVEAAMDVGAEPTTVAELSVAGYRPAARGGGKINQVLYLPKCLAYGIKWNRFRVTTTSEILELSIPPRN